MNLVDIVCSQCTSRHVHHTCTSHMFMHNLQTHAQVDNKCSEALPPNSLVLDSFLYVFVHPLYSVFVDLSLYPLVLYLSPFGGSWHLPCHYVVVARLQVLRFT